jgi:hypothetical protein
MKSDNLRRNTRGVTGFTTHSHVLEANPRLPGSGPSMSDEFTRPKFNERAEITRPRQEGFGAAADVATSRQKALPPARRPISRALARSLRVWPYGRPRTAGDR